MCWLYQMHQTLMRWKQTQLAQELQQCRTPQMQQVPVQLRPLLWSLLLHLAHCPVLQARLVACRRENQ